MVGKKKFIMAVKVHLVAIIIFSLFGSIFFTLRFLDEQRSIRTLTMSITEGKSTDKDRILTLLKFVEETNTTALNRFTVENYSCMNSERLFWSIFYRILPVDLIPPNDVMKYQIGSCGAKSRLFCAMTESAGYECRLLNTQGHTLTEVLINDAWTPLDPLYNIHYENRDGTFVTTDKVKTDDEFFSESIRRFNTSYPLDNPKYQFKNYNPSTHRLMKDELQHTSFYMQPNVFFSAACISIFLLSTLGYWAISDMVRLSKTKGG